MLALIVKILPPVVFAAIYITTDIQPFFYAAMGAVITIIYDYFSYKLK